MKGKHYIISTLAICIISAFMLIGCEQEVLWPVESRQDDFVVVDGIITDEVKHQTIRLSRTFSSLNTIPDPVTGAEVLISTTDSVYRFIEDSTAPGVYNSAFQFAGKINNEYSLFINTNGKIITAKATMPAGADFQFLSYGLHENQDMLFSITWVADQYSAENPAMYEVLLNWSMVPGYENAPYDSTHARLLFYTLPTLDVSQMFAPVSETVLFPRGTHITEKRYSLSVPHAAYLRALLAETNFNGGFFNSVPSNLPVNLSNNGLGFFGASAVTSQSRIAGSSP